MEVCGGDLVAGETPQEFASPGYPSGYANGLQCEWRIRSVPGTRVMFNITNINLESHSSCNFDTVTVTEGTNYSENIIVDLFLLLAHLVD